jgi:two-component system chemotaxis response regulator CheB
MSTAPSARKIFIGASAGGVHAILQIAAALPADFPAPIFFVQHIGTHRSHLDELISLRGPNAGVMASDGELARAGRIYIAPPDRHMLMEGDRIRLFHGPKEHHSRPAIDPLFRSAALHCGAEAVGVVLTGMLDDGAAGLRAIKDCGGLAVVQDPDDAREPSMPLSALAAVDPDHVVPLAHMPGLLHGLALQPVTSERRAPPEPLRREQAVAMGVDAMENLKMLGTPSTFTCPDCGGVLFDVSSRGLVRYRCHTGHAFSLRTLAHTLEQLTDAALWTSLRTMQEKESVLRRLAVAQRAAGVAADAEREADELAAVCEALRKLTERTPTANSYDDGPGAQ